MSTPALVMQPGLPPAVRRVRGYFAPVNRLTATPTAFDATTVAAFDPDTAACSMDGSGMDRRLYARV